MGDAGMPEAPEGGLSIIINVLINHSTLYSSRQCDHPLTSIII